MSALKFQEPKVTADGSERAYVTFTGLETLWFNTGSQCNITCEHCYMESSPTNDALVFISADEVFSYIDEAQKISTSFHTAAFTGGEPFLNKEMLPIIQGCLEKDLKVLVLSNAMKPLAKRREEIKALSDKYSGKLTIRVSLDHYSEAGHDAERGQGSFAIALEQLKGLSADKIALNIAGRSFSEESKEEATQKYQSLFKENDIHIKQDGLIIFPEMQLDDEKAPEITTKCWGLLNMEPSTLMCASSRMIVKKKAAPSATVIACTLLPYDDFFDYGPGLKQSFKPTHLKHIYCSQFCVLGGASCSN
jgi:sulfatase maturation enzyme AslB (radical SAM superfamily)